MRIFKGIENIHSVIDQHEMEWRKERGEAVDMPKSFSPEESVRRRLTRSSAHGSGRFSADRFLGSSRKKSNDVEVVSVIKQQDDKPHSWLYNEVLKAINDAAGDDRRTKIVAVFIPVVQNGKEFEDLPVDVSVTLPPVSEEEINITSELLEEVGGRSEEVGVEEAPESLPEPEPIMEEEAPEVAEDFPTVEPEAEPEPEPSEDFDLLPEGQDKPDEELAEAFSVMEEKLDEALEEQHSEELEELGVRSEELGVVEEEVPEVDEDFPEDLPEPADEAGVGSEEVGVVPEQESLPEPEPEPETSVLEVPAAEVLDFEEFPVIKEDTETPVAVEDVLEEISSDDAPAPLDGLDDDEVFEEPIDAVKRLAVDDDEDVTNDDEEETINLDFRE